MPATRAARSRRHGRSRVAAALVVAMATAALTGLVAIPASAHASGELPHARLSAAGTTVTIAWTAAPDDAADVAVAAGVWPEEVALAYLDVAFGGELDLLPPATEVAAASRDPALQRYLEDRVQVLQDGEPCAGTAEPAADFIADGATIVFECPAPVTDAVVGISLLHDRDPAYRTFSVDGTQQYAVHTAREPAHPWDFTLAQEQAGAVPIVPLVVGAGAVALLGAAVLWRMWRPAGARSRPRSSGHARRPGGRRRVGT